MIDNSRNTVDAIFNDSTYRNCCKGNPISFIDGAENACGSIKSATKKKSS